MTSSSPATSSPTASSTTSSSVAAAAAVVTSSSSSSLSSILYNTYSADDIFKNVSIAATSPTTINILFDGLNVDASKDMMIHNRLIQAIFCLLYSAIFVLGIFGNVLVCYVVFRNKAMQTVTNLFITNLALSDILLCVLAVPFTPLYTFLGKWIFGTVLCHLVPYAQGCSVYISTLTLTAIAIDRFFVIIYPFQQRMRLLTCIIIILIIWTISLVLIFPYGLYMRVVRLNHTGTYQLYCEEDWPSEGYRKIYGTITTIHQFVLPFVIVSICYICVSIRLNDKARSKPGTKTTKKEELDRDRKKRTNRMLIAMVAVFGISWMPLNVVNMLNDFHEDSGNWIFYNVVFFISHSIAMSSTCYNPFLYAWLNDNFRKEFKLVLPCFNPSSARGRFVSGSQRWHPEHTYNGNNETIQESLMTSSFIRSTCPSMSTRESIQLNGLKHSMSGNLILISDIEATGGSSSGGGNGGGGSGGSIKQRSPETIILPSGVLETNFEDPVEHNQNGMLHAAPVARIRFAEEALPYGDDNNTGDDVKCIS